MAVKFIGKRLTTIDFAPTSLMREIGEGLLLRIRRRTEKGLDFKGRAFRALSRQYADLKRSELGHGQADLQVSGRMLNEMVIKPRRAAVTLLFASGSTAGRPSAHGRTLIQRSRSVSGADKAFFHNVVGAGKKRVIREFFNLGDDDVDWAEKRLDLHLGRELR